MTHSTATITELPGAWRQKAEHSASLARQAVVCEFEARGEAMANERTTSSYPYWLASHPCPSWCVRTDRHSARDEPDDRAHDGEIMSVALDGMPPIVISYPEARFVAPELQFRLTAHYREKEPRIYISDAAYQLALHATLDEAEQIASLLLTLVSQGRNHPAAMLASVNEQAVRG
ncbi:DUF6907 domain-containing protein [Nonomuraea typhae]|uniref:DUF6907 domain-containing protein n=1 Tax=Nonomuraea typhae TaxID=2603600 RepID=A0ABW7YR39_9ACTN